MGIPFFGIGAMRAGTTWLSSLLRSYPDCAVTPLKDLHFFDTRYGVYSFARPYLDKAHHLNQLTSKIHEDLEGLLAPSDEREHGAARNRGRLTGDALTDDILAMGNHACWTDEIRRRFHEQSHVELRIKRLDDLRDFFLIRDLASYMEYVTRNGRDAAAFGEITPSYSLLPSQAYSEMASVLPGATFILIMRDPVERLWSLVRYAVQRGKFPHRKPKRVFNRFLQYPEYVRRLGYQRTINELESVIPRERILYLFFEALVSPETGPAEVQRIESALGLQHQEIRAERFRKRLNTSPEAKLSSPNELAAMQLLLPEYEFISERFGIPSGWRRPDFLSARSES